MSSQYIVAVNQRDLKPIVPQIKNKYKKDNKTEKKTCEHALKPDTKTEAKRKTRSIPAPPKRPHTAPDTAAAVELERIRLQALREQENRRNLEFTNSCLLKELTELKKASKSMDLSKQSAATKKTAELQKHLEASKKTNMNLCTQMHELRKSTTDKDLQQKHRRTVEMYNTLVDVHDSVNKELTATKSKIQTMQSAHTLTKKSLEQSMIAHAATKKTLEITRTEHTATKKTLADIKTQHEAAKKSLAETRSQHEAAKKTLDKKQDIIQELQDEIKKACQALNMCIAFEKEQRNNDIAQALTVTRDSLMTHVS